MNLEEPTTTSIQNERIPIEPTEGPEGQEVELSTDPSVSVTGEGGQIHTNEMVICVISASPYIH